MGSGGLRHCSQGSQAESHGEGGLGGASQLWAAPQDACRDLAVISLRDCDDGNKRILKPNLKVKNEECFSRALRVLATRLYNPLPWFPDDWSAFEEQNVCY